MLSVLQRPLATPSDLRMLISRRPESSASFNHRRLVERNRHVYLQRMAEDAADLPQDPKDLERELVYWY